MTFLWSLLFTAWLFNRLSAGGICFLLLVKLCLKPLNEAQTVCCMEYITEWVCDYNLILNLFYTGSRTQNTLRIPVQPVQLISL